MSDLIKEMRSFQLYPDRYLRLGADEIERLTAERDASRRMYVDACLKVAEMTQRIAELEAELEEWKDSCDPGVDKALANSEGENNE